MFRKLKKLLTKSLVPPPPFLDEALGEFQFDTDIGWKGIVELNGVNVELIFGSDGEPPSIEMISMAKTWIKEWPLQHQKIIDYIRQELQNWQDEPNKPDPEMFSVESINLLWSENPNTSMIYFTYPGDEIRAWHVTFNGLDPKGFAYDD